jgi:preprotein translocase subunit SecG
MILFLLTAVILTLLVLIQRGRGGGLAGAFGGAGGSSAFGTKTADVFVKATAVAGAIFFILSVVTALLMKPPAAPTRTGGGPIPAQGPQVPGKAPTTPATPEGAPAAPASGAPAPAAPAPGGGESK